MILYNVMILLSSVFLEYAYKIIKVGEIMVTFSDLKAIVCHLKYDGICRVSDYVIHRFDHDNNGNRVYTIIDSDGNNHVFSDRKKAISRFIDAVNFLFA